MVYMYKNISYITNAPTCFGASVSSSRSFNIAFAVAQLVEALRYRPEGCGFDFRWCHWNFSLS